MCAGSLTSETGHHRSQGRRRVALANAIRGGPPRPRSAVGSDAGHDPQIAYDSTFQCREGLLIARAIVYGDRMLN